ncbi:MAG: PAS domain S-box protein [Microthrixaceae bacterium]|nr:PAS domain S-box protein [Microthrixaceae bacterium]
MTAVFPQHSETAEIGHLRRRLTRAEMRVALLEDVLAAMDGAIFVTDGSGLVTTVNGSACRLTGLSAGQIVGTSVFELLTCASGRQPKQVAVGQCEAVIAHTDGTTRPVLVVTSVIRSTGGERAGFVVVATDISERRQLESDLLRSQKMESVGQLAAGVAHEINTPIQFIGDSTHFLADVITDLIRLVDAQGRLVADRPGELPTTLVELLEEVDLDFVREEAPAAVERTVEGVRRVAEIVGALKRFAHPGRSAVEPTDVNDLVRHALVIAANEYKYVATVDLDLQQMPPVMANPVDLGQVILNLLVNAAHAVADRERTGGERGHITVTTALNDEELVLVVADDGVGIPPERVERIFEPFFTTKEVGRGSGQGLALVRSVIDAHHGRVEVDSEVGRGTTMTIRIPAGGEPDAG